jgi:transposase-like protein
MFSTEESCRAYLEEIRWQGKPVCTKCGGTETWKMLGPFHRCCACLHDFTVTVGTLFADTHKPLRTWFEVIWYVINQKNGVSALGLQRAVGFGSYHTAWNWLHKLRRAMVRPGRDRLSGTVEVDETFVGGAKEGKAGRGAEGKSMVLVATEIKGKGIGRIRMLRIRNGSSECIISAIQTLVAPGSELLTDGWRGYSGVEKEGYSRTIIKESDIEDNNLTPRVHKVASLLKRWLLGTHQGSVAHAHLDYYLDEFTFRFNRRRSKTRGLLFLRLIEQSLLIEPVRGYNLIGGKPFTEDLV